MVVAVGFAEADWDVEALADALAVGADEVTCVALAVWLSLGCAEVVALSGALAAVFALAVALAALDVA